MDRSRIKRFSIYGIVLLFSFFVFGCGTKEAAQQEYVKQYGIVIESWYPFGGRGHTAENFNNETITKIADKHDVTSAQAILRWHIQDGYIAIPGSSNAGHIAENYDIFDFELSEEEMREIEAINEQRRYENW